VPATRRSCRVRGRSDVDPSPPRRVPSEGNPVMNALILEIRAAEGGDDAKRLVVDQYRVYQRLMALEQL